METRTINHKYVGQVLYRAVTVEMIPLDDPTKLGNWGLEGFDEESNYAPDFFTTRAKATAWLRQRVKTLPNMVQGRVEKIEWEPDEFDDDKYGHVLDAIEHTTHVWSFYVGDDRKLSSDGDWAEQW